MTRQKYSRLIYFRAMEAFQFPNQTNFYKGKVRNVYTIGNDLLVMIASDRISAFDVILPRPIPYKGQVLNQLAAYMLEATRSICPNWLIETPTVNSSLRLLHFLCCCKKQVIKRPLLENGHWALLLPLAIHRKKGSTNSMAIIARHWRITTIPIIFGIIMTGWIFLEICIQIRFTPQTSSINRP